MDHPLPFKGEPDWDRLFETASAQEGLFTTDQAAEAGYSPQLLAKHVRGGRIVRLRRGIYRLVHYPPGEHDDLVEFWLWSEHQGVFSHETALSLHGLSDVLPARVHLSLPCSWKGRRLRCPAALIIHHADVPEQDRTWAGCLPVTGVARTLRDCAADHVPPDILRQALSEGLARGLFAQPEVAVACDYVSHYGGGKK